jgi:hypothetical protein
VAQICGLLDQPEEIETARQISTTSNSDFQRSRGLILDLIAITVRYHNKKGRFVHQLTPSATGVILSIFDGL